MARFSLSLSDRAEIARLADEGVRYSEIARKFGKLSRSSISGIVWRHRNGFIPKDKRKKSERTRTEAYHNLAHIEPAKYPFAPDSSCPDFAYDEEHIAAVLAERPNGFPVAFMRRAPRRIAA